MRVKQYIIRTICLLLPLIFLSAIAHTQYDDLDTSKRLKDWTVDSLPEPPPEELIITDDDYEGDPVSVSPVWFTRKDLQSNGGGPDSIRWRKLPDTLAKNLQKDDNFWYVNYIFEKEKKAKKKKEIKPSAPLTEAPFFQTLLWLVIIGGFAAVVIIYLSNSNAGLFRRRISAIASDEEMEVETDNIFEINYQREIEKAVSQGNYRFGVRLMFLRLLKNLSEKKIIQYKTDRTDFDYLMQLYPTKYYKDFFRITRNYEYSWYGQFDIDADKFRMIKNDFETFDNTLTQR